VGAALVAPAASAEAGTQFGETFTTSLTGCTGKTVLQSGSTGPSYAVPFDGVVTSWSHQANAMPAQLKLKVGRRAGPSSFTIVGESELEAVVPGQLNTFSDVDIPVRAGDVLGMYMASGDSCGRQPPGDWAYEIALADVPPGATTTFTSSTTVQLNIAAVVEPDCDSDGIGDESHDSDLGPCPPAPTVAITKRPKDKTKKKTATFEFTASEPGATFECSLDGGPFAACSSPDTIKVRKGKHHFEVRAKDAGANVGPTASDDWKVKKKKK
jgi:hypothetical protein